MQYLGILLAGIAGMVVGYVWYSPFLFGKQWMALTGITMQKPDTEEGKALQKKQMLKTFCLALVGELVTAFVVLKIFELTGTIGFLSGAELVLLLWLGFMMPLQLGQITWNSKPWSLFFLSASQDAVKLLAMAAIIIPFLK